MKRISSICLICLIFISLFVFVGCEEKNSDELLKDKNLAELDYLENTVLSIIKKYLMGDYNNDNGVDWEQLKKDVQKVAQGTNVILIDLTSLSIDGDKILELESRINELNSSLENQDENSFIASISNIYSLIPIYLSEYYKDSNLIKMKVIKSNFLKGLYYSNINDFENAKLCIDAIESDFMELTKNQEYLNENYYKINKNYVIIQGFKMAIEAQEKENVKMRYLESLENF